MCPGLLLESRAPGIGLSSSSGILSGLNFRGPLSHTFVDAHLQQLDMQPAGRAVLACIVRLLMSLLL